MEIASRGEHRRRVDIEFIITICWGACAIATRHYFVADIWG